MAKKLTMQDLFGAPQSGTSQEQTVGLKGIVKSGNLKSSSKPYSEVQYKRFDQPGQANHAQEDQDSKIKKLQAEVEALKSQLAKKSIEADQNKLIFEEKARAQGLSEGESMGESRATAIFQGQLGEIRGQISQLLEALSAEKEAFFKQVELGCRELLTEGLKKLNHEMDVRNQQVIEKVVKNVFSLLGNEMRLLLRLSPVDFHAAKDQVNLWLPLDANQVDIQVVEDPRIQPGGCRLETEAGAIEALRSKMSDRLSEIIGQAFDGLFGEADEPSPADDSHTQDQGA